MKLVHKISIIVITFFVSSMSMGQTQDFGIWTGLKVTKKLNKQLSLSGEVQGRFMQNVSNVESLFFQGGVDYSVTKWYEIGGSYRYSNFEYFDVNRFDFDNTFSHKINDNSFAIRLKYQKSFVTHKLKGDRFRIRFKYSYKVNKKFRPYFKAQYFFSKAYNYSNWNQQRYAVGAVIKIAKKNYLDVFYIYEFETNVARPDKQYVLGVKYKLNYK